MNKKLPGGQEAQTRAQSKYILEVHVAQCMKFKSVFAVIKDLLFDCNVYFDESGMKISNLDNSKVALIHFKAPSSARAFSYYYCERPQVYGISITALHKYLGYISQNNRYTLKLMVDRERTYEMIIEIVSDDDTDTQRFYMKLLDLEDDEGGLDGERFNCIINMPSDKFQRYCRSHALVGDVMDIITVGDQVQFITEDTDGGDRTNSIIKTTNGEDADVADDDDDFEVEAADEDEDCDDGDGDDNGGDDVDEEYEMDKVPPRGGRAPKRKVAKRKPRATKSTAKKVNNASEAAAKKKTSIYVQDKDDPIAGRFALRFLQMFAKAQSLSPNVIIYFKKDYPLVLQYKMSELGDLKFALAPRISPTPL